MQPRFILPLVLFIYFFQFSISQEKKSLQIERISKAPKIDGKLDDVAWKNAVANSYTGAVAPDNLLSNNRIPIDVWAVDPAGSPIPNFGKWSFKGCYPSSVGDISFDYGVGDPIIVSITMQFLGMDDQSI